MSSNARLDLNKTEESNNVIRKIISEFKKLIGIYGLFDIIWDSLHEDGWEYKDNGIIRNDVHISLGDSNYDTYWFSKISIRIKDSKFEETRAPDKITDKVSELKELLWRRDTEEGRAVVARLQRRNEEREDILHKAQEAFRPKGIP